eukprot:TRINITY_DN64772_c0_g1_i1.p1 TRINITY_DN64772_c0_g1~~TRINITY_DN64772_c0_g1_i1.p1  ORF type:complete len:344 (+),score=30.75 TRINITY_DN64772_c0_g1_i1:65-1096(+)
MIHGANVSVKHTFITVKDHSEECELLRRRSDPVPHGFHHRPCSSFESAHTRPPGLWTRSGSTWLQEEHSELGDDDVSCDADELSVGMNAQARGAIGTPRQPENKPRGFSLPEETGSHVEPDVPVEWHGKTLVMVRNLPHSCMLDTFCQELRASGFEELVDSVDVISQRRSFGSEGYALVTFVDSHAAYQFHKMYDASSLRTCKSSDKLKVIPATVQKAASTPLHVKSRQQGAGSAPFSEAAPSESQAPFFKEGLTSEDRLALLKAHMQPYTPSSTVCPDSSQNGSTVKEQIGIDVPDCEKLTGAEINTAMATPPFCYQCGIARRPKVLFCYKCGVRFITGCAA